MNEAENSLVLRQETYQEIFFNEEARRIREAFNNKSDEKDINYLLHQLKCIKTMATTLELPWDSLIPILYRSFTFYIQNPDTNINRRKASLLTAQLIECMSYMSKNGRILNALALYCGRQIDDLDKLLKEKEE